MVNRMNNPTQQPSPALRIDSTSSLQVEALSINCILRQSLNYAANRNLLTVAESTFDRLSDHLTAEQYYALLSKQATA